MIQATNRTRLEFLKSQVGRTDPVLFESKRFEGIITRAIPPITLQFMYKAVFPYSERFCR